ncbi:MAG: AfsR/SARP family transcriptional regulator, partial [Gemmatimonadaceae bacterium]
MTLRLRTFGAVYLERDRTPLGGAHTQRRRLALLAYLAAADRTPVTRDKLIALLWPESDEGSGRHALSQLVYAIRRDLGAEAISAEKETVALNHEVIASDVHAFDEALRAGKLEEAARELRGPFLDGFHIDDAPELERWMEEERSRRGVACARTFERLADEAERRGDRHAAVDWWRHRAALTPTDGRATLHLMRALAAAGDRAGAVQAARVYDTLIREELEAEPDRAVTVLAEELRRAPEVEQRLEHGASADVGKAPSLPLAASGAADTPCPEDDAAAAPPTAPRERAARRAWRWPLAVAAAIALLLALASRERSPDVAAASPGVSSASSPARVVVGDLTGPDTVLALAVREALRAELSNASGVVLASELGMREARSLMRIPAESALRPPRLLDVATRSGAHVAIAGSVVPIGGGAQILLDLLDPSSGRTLATLAERSRDDATLMAAVERLGRGLRAAISRTPPPP